MTDTPQAMTYPHLAIFMSFSGQGGVEQMMLNLMEAMIDRGVSIDLIAVNKTGFNLAERLPPQVKLIESRNKHSKTAILTLVGYLKQHQPKVLFVAKERGLQAALIAKALSRQKQLKISVRLGTNISAFLQTKPPLIRLLRQSLSRWTLQGAHQIIAVSDGVANDIVSFLPCVKNRVHVIPNPVTTPRFLTQPISTPSHPWLQNKSEPLILAAGRLTQQKGFDCLLRAFAQVNKTQPCRLIILGDGALRDDLLALAESLQIREKIDLPGYIAGIWPYLSQADLFVLSSRWEGSPNVLTEALALGIPVVATDCPSGPKEILQQGRYGTLVPIDDDQALAQAMLQTLKNPLPADTLKSAVSEYRSDLSAVRYLQIIHA